MHISTRNKFVPIACSSKLSSERVQNASADSVVNLVWHKQITPLFAGAPEDGEFVLAKSASPFFFRNCEIDDMDLDRQTRPWTYERRTCGHGTYEATKWMKTVSVLTANVYKIRNAAVIMPLMQVSADACMRDLQSMIACGGVQSAYVHCWKPSVIFERLTCRHTCARLHKRSPL